MPDWRRVPGRAFIIARFHATWWEWLLGCAIIGVLLVVLWRLLRGSIPVVYSQDDEPRNAKEKWLMRIVHWGTALLVAFLWWEYVKAREEPRTQ